MSPEQRQRLSAAGYAAVAIAALWALSTVVSIVTQILGIAYAAPTGLNEAWTAVLGAGAAIYVQQSKARHDAAERERAEREQERRDQRERREQRDAE